MNKVYAVAAWDKYYPDSDNVFAVFSEEEKAKEYLKELVSKHMSEGYTRDFYDIIEYEVD